MSAAAQEEVEYSKTEQVVAIAIEQGEFTMNELAHFAQVEEVYTEDDLGDLATKGVQANVKAMIKGQLTIGEQKLDRQGNVVRDERGRAVYSVPRMPVFVAITSGPQSIWKRWVDCTRVESRSAIQIKAVHLTASSRLLQDMKGEHERRFRETLSVPSARVPADWEESKTTPPASRHATLVT